MISFHDLKNYIINDPLSDWFEKKHRQLRIDKLWSNTGGVVLMLLVVAYFILGFTDKNASSLVSIF